MGKQEKSQKSDSIPLATSRAKWQGFTLIELLVCIILVSLLVWAMAAWISPWAGGFLPNWPQWVFWVILFIVTGLIGGAMEVGARSESEEEGDESDKLDPGCGIGCFFMAFVLGGAFLWFIPSSLHNEGDVRASVDGWLREQKVGNHGHEFQESSVTIRREAPHWASDRGRLEFLIAEDWKNVDKNIRLSVRAATRHEELKEWRTLGKGDTKFRNVDSSALDDTLVGMWYDPRWGTKVSERLEKEVRELEESLKGEKNPGTKQSITRLHILSDVPGPTNVLYAVRGWEITQIREIVRCPSCSKSSKENATQCAKCDKALLGPAERPGLWEVIARIDSSTSEGKQISVLWRFLVVNRGEGVGFKIANMYDHQKAPALRD